MTQQQECHLLSPLTPCIMYIHEEQHVTNTAYNISISMSLIIYIMHVLCKLDYKTNIESISK